MHAHDDAATTPPQAPITIDPQEVGSGAMYHLLNAVIAPRPVAWVSTRAADGVANLAPHSFTTIFSTDPPIVGFVSVGRKDSLRNCEATGEFALNIASQALLERLNLTAADAPPDVDEFAIANLTHLPCERIAAPRVAEAPVALETRVVQIIPVGNCWLVLGEVLLVHIAGEVWDVERSRIDPQRLDPVLRLAGSQFGVLGDVFDLRRPTWRNLQAGDAPQREPAAHDPRQAAGPGTTDEEHTAGRR